MSTHIYHPEKYKLPQFKVFLDVKILENCTPYGVYTQEQKMQLYWICLGLYPYRPQPVRPFTIYTNIVNFFVEEVLRDFKTSHNIGEYDIGV